MKNTFNQKRLIRDYLQNRITNFGLSGVPNDETSKRSVRLALTSSEESHAHFTQAEDRHGARLGDCTT
jgi:hypothetical protein